MASPTLACGGLQKLPAPGLACARVWARKTPAHPTGDGFSLLGCLVVLWKPVTPLPSMAYAVSGLACEAAKPFPAVPHACAFCAGRCRFRLRLPRRWWPVARSPGTISAPDALPVLASQGPRASGAVFVGALQRSGRSLAPDWMHLRLTADQVVGRQSLDFLRAVHPLMAWRFSSPGDSATGETLS